MPRLNERKTPTVPTYLNLPQTTRDRLESAIGRIKDVNNLTDAVNEAAKLLAAKVKKDAAKRPPRPA